MKLKKIQNQKSHFKNGKFLIKTFILNYSKKFYLEIMIKLKKLLVAMLNKINDFLYYYIFK